MGLDGWVDCMRAAWGDASLEIAHINEIKGGAHTAAHLLKFDTVHGQWQHEVGHTDTGILVDGKPVGFSEHSHFADVPWADLGIDIVVECSGKFRSRASLQPYFDAGVKKVVVSAPVQDADLNIVMGCNDNSCPESPPGHRDSCTTRLPQLRWITSA